MHVDLYIVLGSAVVGWLVGMTGAGGGALMTPMLILLFGVKAPAAISSDLVAAVLMRPVGAAVHIRQGTVSYRLVGWLALGSVPMAFFGAYLLHLLGGTSAAPTRVEQALGAALLTGAAAMGIRYLLDRRAGQDRSAAVRDLVVRPLPTVA
ncbi:MAG: sulfite exporter TauE/SafE family protein, partial [Actinobacteria bacterium]|nr:sulfite exporter TauE/SafE family protein [Actinomycetota bacterium]